MSLSAGDRLGSYEVLGAIGAGGMGEVYRGRDTRLDRSVAIKVLPDAVARDPERLARFEREAKTLAALNHPNIAQIYGLEGDALVMEFVEGDDLSTRLARGPVPLDDALAIARQIAQALEAAHEQGIIHRDLKPSNIRIRPDGEVKVLDFGLAKALAPASGPDHSAPTITSPAMTRIGVILGTAAYMSPEQARGKAADKRADIWAFGVVLYEMTTGRRPFDGESVTESLAGVMKSEPEWAPVPAALRRLLRGCLEKDPKKRLRDIGDWERQLDDPAATPAAPPSRARWSWPLWIALAALATATGTLAVVHLGESAPSVRPVSFQIHPPANASVEPGMALSADGRSVAFIARNKDTVTRVWVRDLGSVDARPVAGTEGARSVFWSPDSQSVGFVADRTLKRVAIAGGPVLTLVEAAVADGLGGGAWMRDGVIIFGGTRGGAIRRVPESGGQVTPITALNGTRRELVHGIPHALPDGRHFLYTNLSPDARVSGIYVGAVDREPADQPAQRLLAAGSASYAEARSGDGYVLYLSKGALMAQRFDVSRLSLAGEPVQIAEGVGNFGAYGNFASGSRHLAYRLGPQTAAGTHGQLLWMDRGGAAKSVNAAPAAYDTLALAPDGNRAAVVLAGPADSGFGNIDIWILDLVRGVPQRLTTDPNSDRAPVWSPNQNWIAYYSTRPGTTNVYRRLANGVGAEEPLVESDRPKVATSWSSDNRFLLFQTQEAGGAHDLWVLPLASGATPVPILKTSFNEAGAQFSPNTRWIAYGSNSSERMEVYIRPFDPAAPGETSAPAIRVSRDGGRLPRWTRNGRELIFQDLDNSIMAVDISADGHPGTPKRLFMLPGLYWDVTADGSRFLVTAPLADAGTTPITVVLDWAGKLRK